MTYIASHLAYTLDAQASEKAQKFIRMQELYNYLLFSLWRPDLRTLPAIPSLEGIQLSKILIAQMWSVIGRYCIKSKRCNDQDTQLRWTIGNERKLAQCGTTTATTAIARIPHISRLTAQAIAQLCADVNASLCTPAAAAAAALPLLPAAPIVVHSQPLIILLHLTAYYPSLSYWGQHRQKLLRRKPLGNLSDFSAESI